GFDTSLSLPAADPAVPEFLTLDAPTANLARANSAQSKSAVAVVEEKSDEGEEVVMLNTWENTAYPSIVQIGRDSGAFGLDTPHVYFPPGFPFNTLVPVTVPSQGGNVTMQFCLQVVKLTKGLKKGKFISRGFLVTYPGAEGWTSGSPYR